MGKKHEKGVGVCKLTGATGKFVDSHLLPKALTKPSVPGAPLIQAPAEKRGRPIQRWSSWSDKELVTSEGESILSALDTWGIAELRKQKLVWSGWGPMINLQGLIQHQIPGTPWGARELRLSDAGRLRLFFLSVLWRAAETSRWEFAAIEVPPDDLERLRRMILDGTSDPYSFYPIALIQMSTLGTVHNHSPFPDVKTTPEFEDVPEHQHPIFRFYFDGLAIHFHRDPSRHYDGKMVIGGADTLVVTTVTFEHSFQREALEHQMKETYSKDINA